MRLFLKKIEKRYEQHKDAKWKKGDNHFHKRKILRDIGSWDSHTWWRSKIIHKFFLIMSKIIDSKWSGPRSLQLFTKRGKFSVFKCFWLDTLLNIQSKYLCRQKEWICSIGNIFTQICHPSLNKASKGLFSGSYMQAIGTTKRRMTSLQSY